MAVAMADNCHGLYAYPLGHCVLATLKIPEKSTEGL